LIQNPQLKVELSSHTDSRGSTNYNLKLSQARAKSAVRYLVSHGVEPERVNAKGSGESQPVNKCENGVRCTEQEHRQNRRTEIFIQDYGKAQDVIQVKGKR
jgi:outer membrane protein OmpA-like peptidoglycan-associated protein